MQTDSWNLFEVTICVIVATLVTNYCCFFFFRPEKEIEIRSVPIYVVDEVKVEKENDPSENLENYVKNMEKDLDLRMINIEKNNRVTSESIIMVGNRVNSFNSRFDEIISKIGRNDIKIESLESETNNKISQILEEYKHLVGRIGEIKEKSDRNSDDVKGLLEKYEVTSNVINVHGSEIEKLKAESDKNRNQIEDIKLMFVNYDMVLAIEKAKLGKK